MGDRRRELHCNATHIGNPVRTDFGLRVLNGSLRGFDSLPHQPITKKGGIVMLCKYCKKPITGKNVPHEDLENNITYHYHPDCWYGRVRAGVNAVYVPLLLKLTGGKYGRLRNLR